MYRQPNCFLYGVGPAIRAFDRTINHIALTDIPVLLVGENGTGKEEIALEIHYRSLRRTGEFLKFDCHEVSGKLSPFWLAQDYASKIAGTKNGTIFFDQIDQLTPKSQDQLLQLLAGENKAPSQPQRARVISSTARSLEDEVRGRRFHEELYYTINGVMLLVPSLRSRPEDIKGLVDLFLKKYAAILFRPVPQLGTSTMDSFARHAWPGNVRQLESVARKIVELGDEQLALRYFYDVVGPRGRTKPSVASRYTARSLNDGLRDATQNIERDLILKALERTKWNHQKAARELRISRRTLYNKLEKLGLKGSG